MDYMLSNSHGPAADKGVLDKRLVKGIYLYVHIESQRVCDLHKSIRAHYYAKVFAHSATSQRWQQVQVA